MRSWLAFCLNSLGLPTGDFGVAFLNALSHVLPQKQKLSMIHAVQHSLSKFLQLTIVQQPFSV